MIQVCRYLSNFSSTWAGLSWVQAEFPAQWGLLLHWCHAVGALANSHSARATELTPENLSLSANSWFSLCLLPAGRKLPQKGVGINHDSLAKNSPRKPSFFLRIFIWVSMRGWSLTPTCISLCDWQLYFFKQVMYSEVFLRNHFKKTQIKKLKKKFCWSNWAW